MAIVCGPIYAMIKIRVEISLLEAIKLRISGFRTESPKVTMQMLIDKEYGTTHKGRA